MTTPDTQAKDAEMFQRSLAAVIQAYQAAQMTNAAIEHALAHQREQWSEILALLREQTRLMRELASK